MRGLAPDHKRRLGHHEVRAVRACKADLRAPAAGVSAFLGALPVQGTTVLGNSREQPYRQGWMSACPGESWVEPGAESSQGEVLATGEETSVHWAPMQLVAAFVIDQSMLAAPYKATHETKATCIQNCTLHEYHSMLNQNTVEANPCC